MEKDILQYHKYGGSRGRCYMGSNQRAISAKIDNGIMFELDMECAASGLKRNAIINLALKWYIQELDEARKIAASKVYT